MTTQRKSFPKDLLPEHIPSPVRVRTVDAAREREMIAAAGLLDEWERLRALEDYQAHMEAFSLAASILPAKATSQRLSIGLYDVQNERGEITSAIKFDRTDLPLRLQIALSVIVTPDAPPECVLTKVEQVTLNGISASLEPADISAHERLEAERYCDKLYKIWSAKMDASAP